MGLVKFVPTHGIRLRFIESIVSQSQLRQVAGCIISIAFHIPLMRGLSPRLENVEPFF